MQDRETVDVVHLHGDDNIVVAARPLPAGLRVTVDGSAVEVRQPVRLGHKLATRRIKQGEVVRKYGQVIGVASGDIEPGNWVHVHNLAMSEQETRYAYATQVRDDPPPIRDRTFMGYRRADGKAGTRNYLAVISAVNCSASVSKYIVGRFDESILRDYPNVDGVIALTHSTGCGIPYGSRHHDQLNRVLSGFARHPNVAGYLLIGLGCEVATLSRLVESGNLVQLTHGKSKAPPTLSIQDCGGTAKTVEQGLKIVADMLPAANDVKRQPIGAGELMLGLECGGSDGNSGVTANPALGAAADLLVAAGGTAVLSETTEIYGAEHLLTQRARSRQVGEKLIELIDWWKWYAKTLGGELDNNPTPGNKEGGLTTIYEKSLGAVAKGGTTALNGVFDYAQPVTQKGFVVMDTPGYDPPSITGMVAGGANMVCFTTGRGSCYGCKPVPSIKIASNTPMYEHMVDDMDVNAGMILEGATVPQVGRQIFEMILEVASGKKTKSEAHGVGEEEFVPWQIGPIL